MEPTALAGRNHSPIEAIRTVASKRAASLSNLVATARLLHPGRVDGCGLRVLSAEAERFLLKADREGLGARVFGRCGSRQAR